jgi:hypothetical protein
MQAISRRARTVVALPARMALLVFCLLTATLAAHAERVYAPVELEQALDVVPEHLLLDVGIRVFDPGLTEEDKETSLEELEKRGIFPYLRRSEARYYPFQLKNTLESTGHWGAVRVIPGDVASVDVIVSGTIVKSTGKDLVLRIEAGDSTGRRWIKDRKYRTEAEERAYLDDDATADEIIVEDDPYEHLFHEIANDLLHARGKLDEEDLERVRDVSALRFAADLAPDAFGDHLATSKKGRFRVERLPSRDDPMMARVLRVRDSDYEFVDTLNAFYADFFAEMDEPYAQWRKYSYEEQVEFERLRRSARMRKILGTLLLLGGVYAEANGGSTGSEVAGEAAQVAGGLMVLSGVVKGQEAKTHKETLKELAGSLDAEVEPILQEVEGRTLRLSGSAEAQYVEFRRLLREIFDAEVGLPAESVADDRTDPDS